MRVLSLTLAVLASSAFAIVPASACSWGKTASKDKMTVAEIPTVKDGDVAVATNDLSDALIKSMTDTKKPIETPAAD
ncbi:hypothetical protein GCM10011316_19510 [Roseibium aquae]|uniref:Uncharacterized protein n=1 Tax=Roseibium aquae TaxID=1323746 RepID=A0A916TJG7_9HYPH|nr:hypothetical protein [Roseibium aquae]GGB47468.1 hypothetical protein GCM10011316_19510 [Roseibium aquae]